MLINIILMGSLKVLAFNVRGIMSSTICLSDLLKYNQCDVCVISEHKFKAESLQFLCSIEKDFQCISKADELPSQYRAYHGKEGVAILYRSSLQFTEAY